MEIETNEAKKAKLIISKDSDALLAILSKNKVVDTIEPFSGYTRGGYGYKAFRITEKGTIKHHWYWREWHQRHFAQT